MLIEFRVRNFRSFRDEQALSLVAAKDKTLIDTNTMQSGIRAAPALLRSAVVYGPNAGGKSNLIKAVQYMRAVVEESANKPPGQKYNVQPFRLDSHSESLPTAFEATFILEGVRYQYGFELTPDRITQEHLLVYKAFKPQQWFRRYFDEKAERDVYSFSSGLTGPKGLWEKATRSN